ncbi:U7 snRNA-associated Sm-like protein LSm10 [Nilaparvata lugens]|uniref:U7 snRNA-associated Sm-like protein LSm10 n=1 Tax=Nilaparvata lugens TaxID=108931 RepID=UPI000B97E763|nr:U7 snRNA-associated Sm-like protein LSm10 [Nilaparvata lugens]
MALLSSKEKYHTFNGLNCLVKGLEGRFTTIDLRNESFVTGKIEEVDGYMNLTMSKVIFTDQCGRCLEFDTFFVQNRIIRYVHIPVKLNVMDIIQTQLESNRRKAPEKKHTFKHKRALANQKESMRRVAEMKKASQTDKKD